MRRGLITSIGSTRHDKLVASVVKFLITKCDASALDIQTEKIFKSTRGNTYIDIFWNDKLIECISSAGGLSGKKVNDLLVVNKPITLAVSNDLDINTVSSRINPKIKGILVFDIAKEELVKSFKSFDEFLGYNILAKPSKTVNIDP